MSRGAPARTGTHRAPKRGVAGLMAVVAALVGALGYRWLERSGPTSVAPVAAAPVAAAPLVHPRNDGLRQKGSGAIGTADGVVPDGVTVFDNKYPAVTNLDGSLLRALRRAATDAARDGVTFYVDSGWRSRKYQEQLLREAIKKYGSEAVAARWVATPETSAHVSGDAVDIGHSRATAWLSEHGAEYGLCQIYSNEPWHYELRPAAIEHGCPTMYADAAHDPRMEP